MEKLDKVIRALEICVREDTDCFDCPYEQICETNGRWMIERDALAVIKDLQEKLKMAKDGRLELARRCRELEAERDDLNRRIDKYVDALYECGLAMKAMEQENQILRSELAAGVLRGMSNDYGEYPPEFPKEGM